MGRKANPDIKEENLQGFKHFKLLTRLLEPLHNHACKRDKAGNRKLHFDQYAALILLYFFNPILTSLRGIQQASQLEKVQRILGCSRAALGSLSEAARVFDAELLRGLIGELLQKLPKIEPNTPFKEIKGIITLVDGSLLPALPKIVEAMWLNAKNKAFKLHTHFELLRNAPAHVDVTAANTSERAVLAASLKPDRVYVMDRGYVKFGLFQQIIAIGSSLVCRVYDNIQFEVVEERVLSAEARAARVVRDVLVRFTTAEAIKVGLNQVMHLVVVKSKPHHKTNSRSGPSQGNTILILTNIVDAPADVIALLYKCRWSIEIFFRYFKHMLGCRHLLSHCQNGVEIQTYLAIIACLLIALWTGKKPTLGTYEMLCFYMMGFATEEEFQKHIETLKDQE